MQPRQVEFFNQQPYQEFSFLWSVILYPFYEDCCRLAFPHTSRWGGGASGSLWPKEFKLQLGVLVTYSGLPLSNYRVVTGSSNYLQQFQSLSELQTMQRP
jgi:hypothetical protein